MDKHRNERYEQEGISRQLDKFRHDVKGRIDAHQHEAYLAQREQPEADDQQPRCRIFFAYIPLRALHRYEEEDHERGEEEDGDVRIAEVSGYQQEIDDQSDGVRGLLLVYLIKDVEPH